MGFFSSFFFSLFAFLFFFNVSITEATNTSSLKKNSTEVIGKPSQKANNAKAISESSQKKTADSLKKQNLSQKSNTDTKNCRDSGQSLVYSDKFTFTTFSFSSQINNWIDTSLSYMKKNMPKQCPKHCEQINSYQVLSKNYPQRVKKDTCKGDQSKESYSFKKKFLFEENKNSIKKAHDDMTKWILGTFIYPYFPIPLLEPTKESIESNLSKACPSCSFYFDYTYKYTKDKYLALDIKTRCGDIKKTMSSFKAEFSLINYWSCKKPDKKPDKKTDEKPNKKSDKKPVPLKK